MKRLLIIILLIAAVWISFELYYGWQINEPYLMKAEPVAVTIPPGSSVDEVGAILQKAGVIASPLWFKSYVWREDLDSSLKAGTYQLSATQSIAGIASVLVAGEVEERERTITILEGWRILQIRDYLKDQGIPVADEFYALATTPVSEWSLPFTKPEFLATVPAGVDLEGYLFPDTYRIYRDASAADIIAKMLANFNRKILTLDIGASQRPLNELVTMASIIEKEVRTDADRALVAGILYKRMEVGMRLEVDSTVNYATGKSEPAVSLRDLEIESPYNTYRNDGLPPGPIASPGLKSLQAAIAPVSSPYFFYLNRLDTGETIFSRTHEEHVGNKNKYLRN